MSKLCYFLISAGMLLAVSCNNKGDKEVMGWAPVYASAEDITVQNESPLPPIENAGKIYIRGDYFYQVENGKGIHVIDVSNKEQPVQQAFIRVAGAQELSIRGNNLYVNSFNDLVVIDISDVQNSREVHRMKNTFHMFNSTTPPQSGYFECVDESRGTVVSWQQKMLVNPKCRY